MLTTFLKKEMKDREISLTIIIQQSIQGVNCEFSELLKKKVKMSKSGKLKKMGP